MRKTFYIVLAAPLTVAAVAIGIPIGGFLGCVYWINRGVEKICK